MTASPVSLLALAQRLLILPPIGQTLSPVSHRPGESRERNGNRQD
jgi:hypothetical protein